jgi:hypothetical protein
MSKEKARISVIRFDNKITINCGENELVSINDCSLSNETIAKIAQEFIIMMLVSPYD